MDLGFLQRTIEEKREAGEEEEEDNQEVHVARGRRRWMKRDGEGDTTRLTLLLTQGRKREEIKDEGGEGQKIERHTCG